jgi:hypothetical protein
MSASYSRQDRVLSVREREKFRNEIKDKERALQGHLVIPKMNGTGPEGMSIRRQGRWNGFMDPNIQEDAGMLNAQIRHLKRKLDSGSPRSLSRKERSVLEKEVAEDREFFKKNMVSTKLYNQPSVFHRGDRIEQNPQFGKATKAVYDKEVANIEFQKRANRFKNNMRELDPENPDASNIEKFRPKK